MNAKGIILTKALRVEPGLHGPYVLVTTLHDYFDKEKDQLYKKGHPFTVWIKDNANITSKKDKFAGEVVKEIWEEDHSNNKLNHLPGNWSKTRIVIGALSSKGVGKCQADYARLATPNDEEFFQRKYGIILE